MTHRVSWLEGTSETKRQTEGCRLHPDVKTEACVHDKLQGDTLLLILGVSESSLVSYFVQPVAHP